jgi:murein DD-endopeptidase MepM/ murein hydrolase activator NlpD
MGVRIGILSVLFVITVLVVTTPALYGEERVHIVQRGETFFSIARAQGISAEALMRHNGITDPTRLQAGQRLRIPVAGGSAVASASVAVVATYQVVRGDTFFGLARRFSVTVDALRRANNLSEGHILREGEILRLPLEAVIPPGTLTGTLGGDPVVASPPPAVQVSPPPVAPVAVSPPPVPVNQAPAASVQPVAGGVPDPSVRWPVVAREVQSMTGKLSGVVITGTRSEPVRSLTRGTVISAGPYRGFGMVVIVQVEGGYIYVYGGSESLSVREGDLVGPGTELGRLGIDAATNQPKLFFMVYRGNVPVNPAIAPRG